MALAAVSDPRDRRGRRYSLVSMLAVAVCGVLAGACTFAAISDWVRDLDRSAWGRLGFSDRVPAATTVWQLLVRIDAEVLSAVLSRWLRARARPVVLAGRGWRLVIAIDGKVQRGARLPDGRQVHLLSAYDTAAGIVLAQVQVAAKSNEMASDPRSCWLPPRPATTPLARDVPDTPQPIVLPGTARRIGIAATRRAGLRRQIRLGRRAITRADVG